jgi:hypothetical protein
MASFSRTHPPFNPSEFALKHLSNWNNCQNHALHNP